MTVIGVSVCVCVCAESAANAEILNRTRWVVLRQTIEESGKSIVNAVSGLTGIVGHKSESGGVSKPAGV